MRLSQIGSRFVLCRQTAILARATFVQKPDDARKPIGVHMKETQLFCLANGGGERLGPNTQTIKVVPVHDHASASLDYPVTVERFSEFDRTCLMVPGIGQKICDECGQDPFRKANDQRRALEDLLKDRERPKIDPADIGAPHLAEGEPCDYCKWEQVETSEV